MLPVQRTFPQHLARRVVWISDGARLNGIHILGGPGSGKSRLMGRVIAWMDFLRKVPLVMLDPTGGTWANFADRILRLPPEQQQRAWQRVVYVDMSGTGSHVMPIPLLYRLQTDESLYVSGRASSK